MNEAAAAAARQGRMTTMAMTVMTVMTVMTAAMASPMTTKMMMRRRMILMNHARLSRTALVHVHDHGLAPVSVFPVLAASSAMQLGRMYCRLQQHR